MMNRDVIRVYADGSCANNAGHYGSMSIGVNIEGIKRISRNMGTGTNVIAEYQAVITALEELLKMGKQRERVLLHCDNLPVVSQLQGINRVKSKNIRPLYRRAKELADEFRCLQFQWVSRDDNKEADCLSKRLSSRQGAGLTTIVH